MFEQYEKQEDFCRSAPVDDCHGYCFAYDKNQDKFVLKLCTEMGSVICQGKSISFTLHLLLQIFNLQTPTPCHPRPLHLPPPLTPTARAAPQTLHWTASGEACIWAGTNEWLHLALMFNHVKMYPGSQRSSWETVTSKQKSFNWFLTTWVIQH